MSQLSNIKNLDKSTIINNHANAIAIIPSFNESNNIIEMVNEVKKYVNKVIVVDDGSNDDTFEKASITDAIVLQNNRNRGKGAALRRGFLECLKYSPNIIVTIDADGQHDPSDIPKLLAPIQDKKADIVIGSRLHKDSKSEIPLRRGMGLSFINALNRSLTKSNVKDSQSGFRAYSNLVFSLIFDFESFGYGAETEQLAQAENFGVNILEIPVIIKYRGLEKTSKKNAFTHGLHLITTIIKICVERRPLQIFGISGLILIFLSIIPLTNLLMLFNETRYFSIPLALIVMGLSFIGALLILISFILYALKRIRQKISHNY